MSNAAILDRTRTQLQQHPDIEKALSRYARELGVSLDHVIIGVLQMVAEDYNEATGHGQIPAIG
jgi:hypothetical protein